MPAPHRPDHLARILSSGIVAVIRANLPGSAAGGSDEDGDRGGGILTEVCEALWEGGVDVMEITFTVPSAHRILEQVAARLGDRVLLGAGTVLDAETARIAMLSGAQFIVSPSTHVDVIQMCRRYDKVVMPGALTPTEVVTAWQAGADVVKVFPSDLGGPAYLKALAAPLPQVRLMPTGGVNLQTAADFLNAGACALGIGGSLVESRAIEQRDMNRIRSLASQYVQIVRETRGSSS